MAAIPPPKNPGHSYAQTKHISFTFHDQQRSPAPFGYEYFISLPPSYNTNTDATYPLVLFLHGAGESQRGINESYASIRHGVPKIILCYDAMKQGREPAIDIPQALRIRSRGKSKVGDLSQEPVSPEVCSLLSENFITVTPSLNMDYGYGWNTSILPALLDEIVSIYRVESRRIHVTGFSMGGYGTWALGMHSPDRFATLMPICGGGDPILAKNITHVPQWIHHGDLDDIIPLSQSLKMERALRQNGAESVKLTRYPSLKHDSWTAAYSQPEVWQWMLETVLSGEGEGEGKIVPEVNKVVVAGTEADVDGGRPVE